MLVNIQTLLNTGFKTFNLYEQIAFQNVYTKKQLKQLPKELIFWNPETTQIYSVRYKYRYPKYFHTKISGSLNQTKKIKYAPEVELFIVSGIDLSYIINDELKFYRALHADTEPFLKVDNMWLTTPVFQEILNEAFALKTPAGSLVKDESTQIFIPRSRKRGMLYSINRETTGSSRDSLSLAAWDENQHAWEPFKG